MSTSTHIVRYAQEIIDLFDRNNTLSEFNSGTYTGVSLYGLTLWCKYLPEDSVMAQRGPTMVKHTWLVFKVQPEIILRHVADMFSSLCVGKLSRNCGTQV
jgi:hypothetical protein